LPYKPGAGFEVAQSHTNISTHRLGNRYAIDWSMPIGQPIYAARAGIVVSTYAASNSSAMANHIWIEHSDGTIGKYLHLDHRGIRVQEGERVVAAQLIGKSGNTGFSKGPHLHFSVSSLGGKYLYQTHNIKFLTADGVRQVVGGRVYLRPDD
jgi:murein DD-endopeptidase MepM/ murein hydrolase activator NlpD